MSTITTTSNSNPLIYPANTLIDRSPVTGYLYAMVKSGTADTYNLYRSIDAGANWTLYLSVVRTNVQELGSLRCLRAPYDQLVWCYRTSESSQDRIYLRTIHDLGATSPAWNPEVLVTSVANGGTPGLVYTGMDIECAVVPSVLIWVVIAVGTESGGKVGTTLFTLTGGTLYSMRVNNNAVSGYRQWLTTGSGRSLPCISVEHNGDGKTTSTPHLWVGWGRTHTYCTKLAWNGSGWNGPSSFVQLDTATLSAQNYIPARFDGARWVTVAPDPVATSTVTVWERNKANSTTTIRNTPTHPTGVITAAGLSWNTVTGDLRVFAVGTSTTVLYFVDFVRQTGTWGTWTQVLATALLGSPAINWNVRPGSVGNPTRFDVATVHSGSPNTVTYTSLGLNYAPNAPVFDVAAMNGRPSGSAADVNSSLRFAWIFSDPNPADTQSAFALSRQVGAGSLQYFRTSDSTWQATEQQNAVASNVIGIGSGWQPASDAATTFKVKVWDQANNPSVYSDGYVLIPSTVVNPTLTAPTQGSTLATNSVTATWTATEQSARRIMMWRAAGYDVFNRTVAAGAWGNTDYPGTAWTVSPSGDHSVTAGVAAQSLGSVNVFRSAVSPDIGNIDQRITVEVSLPVNNATGASITQWVCGRYIDANNYYVARLDLTPSNGVQLAIFKRTAGTLSGALGTGVFGTDAPGAHGANSIYRIAFDLIGTTLQAKAWIPATQAEPDWQVTVTNETSIVTGTQVALLSRLETGNTNTTPLVVSWRNWFVRVGAVTHDSGWLSSDTGELSYAVPVTLTDLTAYILSVQTRNAESLPGTEQVVGFTVDMVEPPAPTIVPIAVPASGVISVAITNASPVGSQPALLSQDLFRRPALYPSPTLNPFFETNTTDWGAIGCTFTRSNTQAHQGSWSGRLVPVTGVTISIQTDTNYVVSPSLLYAAEGWIRFDTANKRGVILIHWYDSGVNFISSTALFVQAVAGAWIYGLLTNAVPPANAAFAKLAIGVTDTPAAGDAVYVDEVKFRQYDATAGVRVATGLASGATYADWGPAAGTDYEYRALALSATGTSTYGPWTN